MILSVVVPVHNEEENIRPFYKNLTKILSKHVGASYEIIFVNDGSHDNTAEHIRKICAKNKRLKLLQLSRQFGKEA
jgi:glycosyltransferase involved in cell wall biosynthesis